MVTMPEVKGDGGRVHSREQYIHMYMYTYSILLCCVVLCCVVLCCVVFSCVVVLLCCVVLSCCVVVLLCCEVIV